MVNYLRHLLTPHHTNNHRAKILHPKLLAVFTIAVLLLFYSLVPLQNQFPSVLGISSNITVEDLLALTNQERVEEGLKPLTLNQNLVEAAAAKADYMFEKNFWAHVAPDGTTPWYFIRSAGYEYQYAGENLARGFTNSSDVVNAWMDSPTHRANLLSPNYEDIGFAIGSGSLTGAETILIVQKFGSKYEGSSDAEVASLIEESDADQGLIIPDIRTSEMDVDDTTIVAAAINNPLIDSKSTTFSLSTFLLGLFILVLIVDVAIIKRKKVSRVVSHNLDHVIFLVVMLISIMIISGGVIL